MALSLAVAADVELVQPNEVAARLAARGPVPVILYVGPNILYRSRHIPGAVYAGMGARPEGLQSLRAIAGKLPRSREIVIYCGCCPWDHCPNIKPAFAALKQMGFAHVKAIYLETGFAKDWLEHGYPSESGEPRR
jgi:thiosulfate/3-mercaptopyruvate sulfurtransferase